MHIESVGSGSICNGMVAPSHYNGSGVVGQVLFEPDVQIILCAIHGYQGYQRPGYLSELTLVTNITIILIGYILMVAF